MTPEQLRAYIAAQEKLVAQENQKEIDYLTALRDRWLAYAKTLEGLHDKTATREEFEKAHYELKLRLDKSEKYFLEWNQGDQVLNDAVYDPLSDPSAYQDKARLQRVVVEATAKFDHLIEELKRGGAAVESAPEVSQKGIFVAGQQFDALRAAQKIIDTATKSIQLIDGYVDEKTLDLFAGKPPGATVEILTKTYSVKPALTAAAAAFNKQYGGLAIRTSGVFHDRFLIIDGTDVYHFGASIKGAGAKAFMFSRIEESLLTGVVTKEYAKEWATAAVVI
jgi:hypothetical protein